MFHLRQRRYWLRVIMLVYIIILSSGLDRMLLSLPSSITKTIIYSIYRDKLLSKTDKINNIIFKIDYNNIVVFLTSCYVIKKQSFI